MPWNKVMSKFKQGSLSSGSSAGPKVKNRKQAVAIMLSEKKKAKTNPEYAATIDTAPSPKGRKKLGFK
jgi:hypothetical protein